MKHLTLTGVHAGRTLCGAQRGLPNDLDTYAHAVYAPLHLDTYRADVCLACLREYLASYDPDETKPAWASDPRLD